MAPVAVEWRSRLLGRRGSSGHAPHRIGAVVARPSSSASAPLPFRTPEGATRAVPAPGPAPPHGHARAEHPLSRAPPHRRRCHSAELLRIGTVVRPHRRCLSVA
ncbi:Os07g0678100 [Oryza sativa Japonica Group]|uniref:Os07g0678100 protein n=2 Tax=Oryza sativa subsp. japonica TaxID=39947 RepID=Q7XIW6_ORYSJ|nr:hypothetical protein [Oryza sativa Japonica Group]BAT03215.1 Os07g0678100 [Oryza sativa Japonica Group]